MKKTARNQHRLDSLASGRVTRRASSDLACLRALTLGQRSERMNPGLSGDAADQAAGTYAGEKPAGPARPEGVSRAAPP